MKTILSKGSQKLLDWQQEATLKRSIYKSDSQDLAEQAVIGNETAQDRRVKEFLNSECSWEAFESWNIYLKEKSQKFREKHDANFKNKV